MLLDQEKIIKEGRALIRLVCRNLLKNAQDDKTENTRFYRNRDWKLICRMAEIQDVESILYQSGVKA